MAQKYVNVKEAAKMLGTSEAQVKEMLDRRELHGYRDGADWKFKIEEVEQAVKDRPAAAPAEEDASEDVLLSEVELGESELGTSGTVIGMENRKASNESDIRLAESDVRLAADSHLDLAAESKPTAARAKKDDVDSKVAQFEELDLALDEDLTLDDSTVASTSAGKAKQGDSAVDLTGKHLDDDDLVLGGSGTGSDVTIGGDSGISLVDPADSGLSLEEPLNLTSGGDESLELGEDDLLTYASDTESPTSLKSEDDFQLTPMEDASEGDDSESGSQVIALDTESEGNEAATMIAPGGGMAAMLDEDLSFEPALGLGAGVPLVAAGPGDMAGMPAGAMPAGAMAAGMPMMTSVAALPEAPYSVWDIVSLIICLMVLVLAGMMMYDILQNMWSWNGTHGVNTPLMDWIVGLFDKQ